MMAQVIDFKTRREITLAPIARPDHAVESQSMFEHFDKMHASLIARLGDDTKLYVPSFKNATFDTYGFGCSHNSLYQYQPRDGERYNQPYPIMADLRLIEQYFKGHQGKTLTLGHKSDPFMWMDHKYSITKSTLELANKYNIKLRIKTISDLCASDTYIDLLNGHEIEMCMGIEEWRFVANREDLERKISPGAPSIARREAAVAKLRDAGIKVTQTFVSLRSFTIDQFVQLEYRTGVGRGYWTDPKYSEVSP